MALFQCNYYSQILGKNMGLNVILPEDNFFEKPIEYDEDGRIPVLYLLHGYTGNQTDWQINTKIELYAQEYQIAVVMPNAEKSFYTDMIYGDKFFQYISEEVPEYVCKWFPISKKKEHNYIAGNSMGGYGAVKIGLSFPERFNAIASLSGSLLVSPLVEIGDNVPDNFPSFVKRTIADLKNVYKEPADMLNEKNDPCLLMQNLVKASKEIPRLYICCGTEDFIYPFSAGYTQVLTQLGVEFEYSEEPETHNWRYWDRQIDSFLEWALKKERIMV